ncbi:Endo-type membrane-bound lytic murein transglycosylase A precursor [compost metagenome]
MATKPLALPLPDSRKLARNFGTFTRAAAEPRREAFRMPWEPMRRGGALLLAGGLVLSLGATARLVEAPKLPAEVLPVTPVRSWTTVDRIAPPPAAQYPYKDLIAEMATKYGLSPELVAGVVYIESNFDKNSVSHAGAIGLMQLMPATARPLAKRLGMRNMDLTDPRMNLELGCYFLSLLLDKYDNHLPTALSFYNGGRWGIVSRGVYRNRRYIRKVMDSYWRYAQPVSNGFSTATRDQEPALRP